KLLKNFIRHCLQPGFQPLTKRFVCQPRRRKSMKRLKHFVNPFFLLPNRFWFAPFAVFTYRFAGRRTIAKGCGADKLKSEKRCTAA
ncbi:hypothetical protein, partial [Rugamonas sp.]|uniref:hypothetical protein n=1 Tax=Rugamonas sp. TaxID=1926287 RepID=UPI0025D39499